MKRKRRFGLIVTVLLACFMAYLLAVKDASCAAGKVIKWKNQTNWGSGVVSFKETQELMDVIKKRTDGRLVIELFPAGALMPNKEVFNAVKRGMIEMGTSAVSYFQSQVPIVAVVSQLPFNFKDYWEAVYFHQGMGFEKILRDAIAEHGVNYFTRLIYANELALSKPVRKMEDFKGLKLRSSGHLLKYLTSIGAAASYISGPDIYAALSTGVVDGAHWGEVRTNEDMGFYEVCKYHLNISLSFGHNCYLVNQQALNRLPGDIQKILCDTLNEVLCKDTNRFAFRSKKRLYELREEGKLEIIDFPPDEYVKLQNAAVKIWNDVGNKSPECAKGVQMLKDFNKQLGRLR